MQDTTEYHRCDQCTHVSPTEAMRICRLCNASICFSCRIRHEEQHLNWQQTQPPLRQITSDALHQSPSTYDTTVSLISGQDPPVQPSAPVPGLPPRRPLYNALAGAIPAHLYVSRKRDKLEETAKDLYEKEWVRHGLKAGGAIAATILITTLASGSKDTKASSPTKSDISPGGRDSKVDQHDSASGHETSSYTPPVTKRAASAVSADGPSSYASPVTPITTFATRSNTPSSATVNGSNEAMQRLLFEGYQNLWGNRQSFAKSYIG